MSYQYTNPMEVRKEERKEELATYTDDPEQTLDDFLLSSNPTPNQVQTALMLFAWGKPSARMEILQHLSMLGLLNRIYDDSRKWFTLSHMLALMGDEELDEFSYVLILSAAISMGLSPHTGSRSGQTAWDLAQERGNMAFLRVMSEHGLLPNQSNTLAFD